MDEALFWLSLQCLVMVPTMAFFLYWTTVQFPRATQIRICILSCIAALLLTTAAFLGLQLTWVGGNIVCSGVIFCLILSSVLIVMQGAVASLVFTACLAGLVLLLGKPSSGVVLGFMWMLGDYAHQPKLTEFVELGLACHKTSTGWGYSIQLTKRWPYFPGIERKVAKIVVDETNDAGPGPHSATCADALAQYNGLQ